MREWSQVNIHAQRTKIHVQEESITDFQNALEESSTPSQDDRYSLSRHGIEEKAKHHMVVTSIPIVIVLLLVSFY